MPAATGSMARARREAGGDPEQTRSAGLQIRIDEAEAIVLDLFLLGYRRHPNPKETHLPPFSFDFDDLRIYVRWRDDPSTRPTGLDGILFEVQIKTFLQHAWGHRHTRFHL